MRRNQVVKPLAIQVAPAAPLAPVALEGEIMEPEKFEPIPHNDQKAIGDAVNHLLENFSPDTASRVTELEERNTSLETRISELEQKMERLLDVWGDPDSEAGDKGAGGDADKH
jgi:hypothetical protein